MATVAQIRADLVGSSAVFCTAMVQGQQQANASLTAIQAQAKATSKSIEALTNTAKAFVGFEAIKSGIASLLDAQKAVQQIHYTLLSATGSGAAADAAYAAVAGTADKLGLSLQTAELGFAQMSAAATANGVSMTDQKALFEGVAKSATVLHLSTDQSGSAILALSQIFAKGKIQAQELQLQLGQAIPGVVPRFQQAVMKMVQGTDLAGKSFQQLLEGGDLTVQRFLPALIEALNQTGKGAEGAATGLNAEANRLSTAWFKLKADLSGGLFSDAAIASLHLVASNLGNIAGVAGVAGGVLAARVIGGGLSTVATKGGDAIASALAAREAALATAQTTAATVADTAATVAHTEAGLRGVTVVRAQAFEARQAAAASYQQALAEARAAEATLTHQAGAATLSANLRAQEAAMARATIAQKSLERGQRSYDIAVAAGNDLKAQQIALEARLIEAKAVSATATEAQAAAEVELAATSRAGLLARGLSSVGSAALGLVGGPLGLLVLGIGAVGYAIADANKKAAEFQKQTEDQAASLVTLRAQVQGATADFGTLQSAMGVNQAIDLFKTSSDQVNKTRDQIADLEKQAKELQSQLSGQAGALGSGGLVDPFAARSLDEINERIRALRDTLPGASAAVDELGAKLAGNLVGSINGVKSALAGLKSGASIADVIGAITGGVDKGIAQIATARENISKGLSDLASDAKGWDKTATEAGKTPSQIARSKMQRIIDNIKSENLSAAVTAQQIADAQKQAAPALAAADSATNADAAKKSTEAAAQATKHWQEQAASLNTTLAQQHDELTAQLDSTTKLTPAQKLLAEIVGGSSEAYNHAAAGVQKKMLADATANAELSKSILLQQQADKAAERSAALNTQLADNLSRQRDQAALDVAGVGMGTQEQAQAQEQLRIRQQYDQQRAQYLRDAAKPGASPASDVDLQAIANAQAEALKIDQDGFQSRLEAQKNWSGGARTAFQDYIDSAADAASQSKAAFTDAFSGMEDALVSFATTGKLSFKSFATSVLTDLARMEIKVLESQVLQMILGAFLPSGSSGTSQALGSAGNTSYLSGSYNTGSVPTGFSISGGRANGGPVMSGSMYQVAEGGKPELLTQGSNTYLMTGQGGGRVTQASSAAPLASGGGNQIQLSVTTVVEGDGTSRSTTSSGQNDAAASQLSQRMATVAKQTIANEMRNGGLIWSMRNGR